MFQSLRKKIDRRRNSVLTPKEPESKKLAIVLSGGGARSAYQAGVLKFIAQELPDLKIEVYTGVSAGAINTIQLANHTGNFREKVDQLVKIWGDVTTEKVFESEDNLHLAWRILKNKVASITDHDENQGGFRSLVDTSPLEHFLKHHLKTKDGSLSGIAENLLKGEIESVAITTTNYSTSQNITWVQGGYDYSWTRPHRRSVHSNLSIDHIMASAALPFLFPAVRIGNDWHGDGGVRLAAPLSPALRLGADKILTISNRYNRTQLEGDTPDIRGYPPAAQVMGVLMSSIFLDMLERDATTLRKINKMIDSMPPSVNSNYRHVDMFIIRPSQDLSAFCANCQPRISGSFGSLVKRLGTGQTKTPEWLSMVMFEPEYVGQLIEIGEKDAAARADELLEFLDTQRASHSGNLKKVGSEKV